MLCFSLWLRLSPLRAAPEELSELSGVKDFGCDETGCEVEEEELEGTRPLREEGGELDLDLYNINRCITIYPLDL